MRATNFIAPSSGGHRSSKSLLSVFAVLLVPLALVLGCSSGSDEGDMAGAPDPNSAKATGPAVVDGSTTTKSFEVTGQDSEAAIKDYESLATSEGWTTEDGPTATGTTDWTLTMTKDDATLRVSTAPFESSSGSGADVVQVSLQVTTGS